MNIQPPSAHRPDARIAACAGVARRGMPVRVRSAIAVGVCALLLGACGQKGDLYLPDADPDDARRRPPLEDVDTGDLRE